MLLLPGVAQFRSKPDRPHQGVPLRTELVSRVVRAYTHGALGTQDPKRGETDEIRKLAERTVQATKEISTKITTIQEDARQTIASMKANVEEVKKGSSLTNEAGAALSEIKTLITGSSDMIQQIADAASEHLTVTESMTNTVEETMREAQELDQMAESLQELVSRFRIL